jgi:hypothetical protein
VLDFELESRILTRRYIEDFSFDLGAKVGLYLRVPGKTGHAASQRLSYTWRPSSCGGKVKS